MAMGDAIAQGITLGLGKGAQQVINQRIETKREDRQFFKDFERFKKQRDYVGAQDKLAAEQEAERKKQQALLTTGVTKIGDIRKSNETWAIQANKPLETLKDEYLAKVSKGFTGKELVSFRNDAAKRINGWDKARFLEGLGYTLGDYSEFVDNPMFADAIPKSKIAGSDFDMTEQFKYTPSTTFLEQRKITTETMSESEKRALELQGATLMAKSQVALMTNEVPELQGVEISDSVAHSLITSMGGVNKVGETIQREGQTIYPAQETFKQLYDSGIIVKTLNDQGNPTFDYASNVAAKEFQTKQGERGARVVTRTTPDATLEPTVISTAERDTKVNKTVGEMGSIVAESADLMQVGATARELSQSLAAMPEESRQYLTGFLASVPVNEVAANLGSVAAKDAKAWLQKYANVRNTILKERSGAAVTAPEFDRFKVEVNDPGFLATPEGLMAGLDNISTGTDNFMNKQLSGYRGTEGEREYLRRNPQIARDLGRSVPVEPTQGKPEGVNDAEWNEVLNVMSAYNLTQEELDTELKDLYPSYGVTPDQAPTQEEVKAMETGTPEEQDAAKVDKALVKLPADLSAAVETLEEGDRTYLMNEFQQGRATAEDIKAYVTFLAQKQ